MTGIGIGQKRLQHNIVDLFPVSPTNPDRWSLHGEWKQTHIHTHLSIYHVYTHVSSKKVRKPYFLQNNSATIKERPFWTTEVVSITKVISEYKREKMKNRNKNCNSSNKTELKIFPNIRGK